MTAILRTLAWLVPPFVLLVLCLEWDARFAMSVLAFAVFCAAYGAFVGVEIWKRRAGA